MLSVDSPDKSVDSPMVSLVTRTRDRSLMLQRLARKLSDQVYKKFEWIIVNDCGCRESVEAVKTYALQNHLAVRVIHNTVSRGRSYPANVGVEAAGGKYVLIIDDDDYLHDRCLGEMVDFIEAHDWLGGVAVRTQVVNEVIENGVVKPRTHGHLYSPEIYDFIYYNVFFSNPTPVHGVMVRKDAFLDVGGFPLDIEYTEDWCFWFQFTMKYDVGVIPRTLAFYSHRISKNEKYKNSAVENEAGERLHRLYELKWKNRVYREKPHLFLNTAPQPDNIVVPSIDPNTTERENRHIAVAPFNKDLDAVYASYTWRVGRMVMYLPGKLISMFKRFHHFVQSKR